MKNLLIIGGGKMGYAIASGIALKKVYKKRNILILEKNIDRAAWLKKQGFKIFSNLSELKRGTCDAVILAVKPSDIPVLMLVLKKLISNSTLLISIAAGVQIKKIKSFFKSNQPIIRVMPNLPVEICKGLSVITCNKHVSKEQKQYVFKVFSTLGSVMELKEEKFNLITAVSGSGPAYICYFIECLIDSAVKGGINKKMSTDIVLATVSGTVNLLLEKDLNPAVLRENVTSPKGTTESALNSFKKNRFSETVISAVKAAEKRAAELNVV